MATTAAASGRVPAGDSISRHTTAPVSVDIFETGAGQLDVGPNDNRTVYDLHRQDGKWYAEHMQGPSTGGQLSAAALPDLARKIADRHGVSGTVSIEDERGKGKSLSQRFEHTTKATPAVSGVDFGEIKKSDMVQADGAWGTVANVQPAVPGYEAEVQVSFQGGARKEWIPASRITAHESRRANQQAAAERAPRSEPFNPRVANGGNLPPRREGENDTAYSIRTAPSDDAARRLLNGYSVGGLRALLRSMNLSAPSGSNKADLVERAMQPRQRYWNSIAISKL